MAKKSKIQFSSNDAPLIPASKSLPEITLRALILGTLLTIILAAANAYLGLKVGQTVSASIPAAIISMGILRFFRNSNVLENTMVQTMASVGEALIAGVTFILPALIILHAWEGFYYWQTVIIALLGGTLGVLFTIPLRRALLLDPSLRYPEGVAIGNVLKASSDKKTDISALSIGGLVGALISLCQAGFQVLTDNFYYWVKTSNTVYGFGLGLSPALLAAGYIVGVNVALSMLVGIIIGWLAGIPAVTWFYGLPATADTAGDIAMTMWREHIRYMGVGTMLVAGLWTIFTLIKPITQSIATSVASIKNAKKSGNKTVARTERDIPIQYVFWGLILLLIPIFIFIALSVIPEDSGISGTFRLTLSAFGAIYILLGGFVFCSIAAYFAGLIGATNTPVSGLLVASLCILCMLFLALFGLNGGIEGKELLGVILGVGSTVIIGAGIAIANDTMQDLKVGQMLGATPWKQQVMLILGVLIASFVVPPILDLLYNAYGIGGVFPRPDMDKSQMLAAPQAGLMAAVAQGVYKHNLQWTMISIGAVIAVICMLIDQVLKQFGGRLPVLAVGVGIYLPLDSSVPVIIGGVLSHIIYTRLSKRYPIKKAGNETKITQHKHRGLTLACGIVAGASIMGVVLAIPFAIKQSSNALKIMPDNLHYLASFFGILVTFLLCAWIYRVVMQEPKKI
jgi:putative OPT family oligopeptide transporter